MNAYETGRMIGAVVGMLVGIGLVALIFMISNKNKKIRSDYDERQKIIRGKGYQYGFYAMVFYGALIFLLGMGGIEIPMEPSVEAFSYIFVGIVTDIVYCIFHDAYWGLNNNKKRYLIIMGAVSVVNLLVVVGALRGGELVVDGKLSTMGVNLLCTVLFVVMFVSIAVKMILEKREA